MVADPRIPVTVVTGFLGAGKTTLVNGWLEGVQRGDVAVIVNEHGDVGIDGELLSARVEVLLQITGGCVCCTTQAELVGALQRLARSASRPKRILVETSGAASPSGVLAAIARGGQGGVALDGVITVVDALRVDSLAEHELAFEQLGYADVVVLSRADTCGAVELAHAAAVVAQRSGAAVLVHAAHGKVVAPAADSLDALLQLRSGDLPARSLPTSGKAHVYQSVSLSLDGDVDGERFADFVESDLAGVGGRIFRTKGILGLLGVDERMIVQGVADSVEVTFGAAWNGAPRTSRLVVVGFGLDGAALAKAFAACAATPA
jgi:G3E family GTPase